VCSCEGVELKALIQRVKNASVSVMCDDQEEVAGSIGMGLLVFLGVNKGDTKVSVERLLDKILRYRIFPDDLGRMNCSLLECKGELLVVSQFTLVADTQKGLRPSFSSAGAPKESEVLYDYFISQAKLVEINVQSGRFGADMDVSLTNDGPVTFMLGV